MGRTMYRTAINFPEHLKRVEPIPEDKKYRPYLPSPLTLVELAIKVINEKPFPLAWYWTIEDVGDWIENTLGFHQYRECFTENLISGRKLLLVHASALPKMNITNFDDIKKITAGIRVLFGIDMESYHRSISLLPRSFETLFLFYRQPTGPTRELTARLDFLRLLKIGQEKKPLCYWKDNRTGKEIPGKVMIGLCTKKRVKEMAEPEPSVESLIVEEDQVPIGPALYTFQLID